MILLNNVGAVLHLCAEAALPNLGVNLDVGHSFAALEAPAQSAVLLAGKGRLFYVHANDNTGEGGDWDMLSGSVHFWHWVEFLLTLDAVAYDGWISADIMPKFGTAQQFYATHVRMIRRMCRLIEATGTEQLRAMVRESGNTPAIYDLLTRTLEQAGS
jgi:xylose isomerase